MKQTAINFILLRIALSGARKGIGNGKEHPEEKCPWRRLSILESSIMVRKLVLKTEEGTIANNP